MSTFSRKHSSPFLQAFCEAHPERKLVKKWVTDQVKELAEKTVTGWRIKSEGPSESPLQPPSQEPDAASKPGQQPSDAVQQTETGTHAKPGALLKFLTKVS